VMTRTGTNGSQPAMRLGQRFESARRLFSIGLSKAIARSVKRHGLSQERSVYQRDGLR
jgi:hypothetical protein